jgi:hypothetical protein
MTTLRECAKDEASYRLITDYLALGVGLAFIIGVVIGALLMVSL